VRCLHSGHAEEIESSMARVPGYQRQMLPFSGEEILALTGSTTTP